MTPASLGRYRVTRVLGEGSMGRVLLAEDSVLGRDVAIKHLRPELTDAGSGLREEARASLRERMRHEARAAARASHPSLVALHDLGEDDAVGLYLVFERVTGPTLRERIAAGPLPSRDVGRMAAGLGDALTTLHEAGVLHRDVKPENVFLARTGAKLSDFGIARVPGSRLTAETLLFGTLAYSAPETLEGAGFSERSDQFGLAATLYEALSGRPAFGGDDPVEVAHAVAHVPPPPVAARLGLHGAVDRVLSRGLSTSPDDRFPSCRAFGAALEEALALPSPEVEAGRARVEAGRAELPRARSRLHVALGVAAVVAVGALLWRSARSEAATLERAPAAPSASCGGAP